MYKSFPLDLKVARRKSGLTQADCAHLLDVHPSKISHLECGAPDPTLRDICGLSLIYGKSFESLFADLHAELRGLMRQQLTTMPAARGNWIGRFNRADTLDRLARQLEASDATDGASA